MISLAKLRSAEAAATPGEWNRHALGKSGTGLSASDCLIYRIGFDPECLPQTHRRQEADALFIAESRNAMPELLDWIERAVNEFKYLKSKNHESDAMLKLLEQVGE